MLSVFNTSFYVLPKISEPFCMLYVIEEHFFGGIPFFFGNISLFGIYLKIGIEVVAYILTHNTV